MGEKMVNGDARARNDGLGDGIGGSATAPQRVASGGMMDQLTNDAVGVSLMSGSSSTPTPIVKKESNELEPGKVHKKDALIPDGDVQGTHPR